jgi:hypothetical protein
LSIDHRVDLVEDAAQFGIIQNLDGDDLRLGPSEISAPILNGKTAPSKTGEPCPVRSARTTAPLGTRRNTRSQIELGMWRGQAWRGRARQAFGLGELGVMEGTTANSLAASYHEPPG